MLFFDFATSGCHFWLPFLVAVLQAKTIHGILLSNPVNSGQWSVVSGQ